MDTVTQVTVSTGAAFKAAPSRYPHMSLAYASDGAEDADAVTLRAALAAIEQPTSCAADPTGPAWTNRSCRPSSTTTRAPSVAG
ncbi:hypothetical protein ACFRCI_16475 [Streptomyces sp. NPDC056638]|uniref:hypothetical protein n=1 Tax=Streptomyces sp. NPDC056638 TaxID=3345887 RepID=UPI0036B31132